MPKLFVLAFLLVATLPYALAIETVQPSPAEQRINAANKQIAADPKHAQAYNELALALIRRGRETDDPACYQQAEAALKNGVHLAPADFQLAKTQAALLLARRQFPQALAKAQELNKKAPDDVTVYGYLAEADLALGNYDEAEKAAQWMLNLRPNNVPGLLLAADLRLAYGDTSGALDLLNQAFGETPPTETEEQAWIANRMAAAELHAGQLDAAAQTLARSEELFPDYPATTILLARLRLAQHKPAEAIGPLEALLADEQKHHAAQAATFFLLATAEQEAAKPEAAAAFTHFEQAARAESTGPDDDNDELILFYAGLPGMPASNAAQALELAQREVASRHDAATLDAYAWALFANGKSADAEAQIQRALAVGIRDVQLDEHAGKIARRRNQPDQAAVHFAAAIEANPSSPYAAEARKLLGGQQPTLAMGEPAATHSALAQPATIEPAQVTPQPRAAAVALEESHDTGGVPTALLIPKPTGTARTIRKMQGLVAANPKDAQAYAGLGAAFNQRARETGDVEDFNLAEQALTKSLDLVSTDLSSTAPLETMAAVCMGEHRFEDALVYAQRALALGSGDLSAFAIVGDAYADMGEYEKASIAYSRLQASSTSAGYAQQARTAYLKFVSGDTEGAIAEMESALGAALQARLPSENLAWLYFELGEFSYQAGRIQPSADAYLTALTVYPGDYRALAGLGKVRAAQGDFKAAITLYQSAIAVVPMPIYIAELGDIYARTGAADEAQKQYKLVEYIGRLGHINQVLHNRDLALFYADHAQNLAESLTLAHKEFEVRSDIYTWDALAWAFYKNGRAKEANQAMTHALRLGTKDAMLLFHAGMISSKLGEAEKAARQLDEAMKINPHFHVLYAAAAQQQLSLLHKQGVLASSAALSPASSETKRVQ